MPMDKNSTSEFKIDGSVIRQALKKENFPKPCVASLEFIRNFARNFKVQKILHILIGWNRSLHKSKLKKLLM